MDIGRVSSYLQKAEEYYCRTINLDQNFDQKLYVQRLKEDLLEFESGVIVYDKDAQSKLYEMEDIIQTSKSVIDDDYNIYNINYKF
ncbi:hypothetical protein O9G_000007 [Rozella allomycis CSF55]|uniref:Uncharacterized protein n=1 Tax=Rozella allomycis (strain CSF55) TaxID=988480 RepID=A0A075AS39_ROZAC|nr:hypothetical protein O9G_000007 [Rozella allomycis CSF55]|eukprot:EPZ31531.1 hypothetical protein O9G_000007 [Rozella allomycis CSF55]